MTHVFNFGNAMLSRFETREGIEPNSFVKDCIPKSWFMDLDEKEVDNVNKDGHRDNTLNYKQIMHLMNGEFSMVLI